MFKFFGEPSREVKNSIGNIVFRFDSKGEFITDDKQLVERCKRVFDHVEMTSETTGERIKIKHETPKITITNNLEKKEETNLLHCKKCDFTAPNHGDLMVHYRKAHPKEE